MIRNILQASDGFTSRRPEFEIVGAFAADPLKITDIISGDGTTPSRVITATTEVPHQLNQGTPIRISGVSDSKYNISTKVQSVDPNNNLKFTYIIESNPASIDPDPSISGAEKVTVETDTVSGASPYIFNISMRSVWGMNGMHTDGSKATGFRSMVVAQFTGVSLQKDDRAFVKYNPSTRNYSDNITINEVTGGDLSAGSSSSGTVYHLDSGAIYRKDWNSTHIRMSNDAILQIVSVFAIGYNKHFSAETGSDASITNSNSNFGQLALTSSGFKKDAFRKDDKVFISHVIGPRTVESSEETIDWIGIANTISNSETRLYLDGFENPKVKPPILTQGFRIGAKANDKLFLKLGTNDEKFASIVMSDGENSSSLSSFREAIISSVNSGSNNFSTSTAHGFESGQKVIIISDNGDYPENIKSNTVYFIIKTGNQSFKLASSKAEADDDSPINVAGGTNLRAISRVSDMNSGDVGHPVQYDSSAGVNRWYINATSVGSDGIYENLNELYNGDATEPSFVKRKIDARSLDEKIYKFRLVVPKEFTEAKNPESAFIIQESSTTGFIEDADSTKSSITTGDYDFNRNPRFISTCSYNSVDEKVTVLCEKPHNLNVNDVVIIRNVKDSTVTGVGTFNKGYNGTFTVSDVDEDALTFKYKYEKTPTPGSFTNDTTTRDRFLPRFERNDLQTNAYLYRNELISEYDEGNTHGVYHSFVLNSNNHVTEEFTDTSYSQKVTDFYPQLDRDNVDDNPLSARSFALRSPLGEVETSDLKKSITKESADLLLTSLGVEKTITNVNAIGDDVTITFDRNHNFTGITTYTTITNGVNYTNGTYQNVKLLNDSQSGTWKGATANVFVSGGGVSTVEIVNTGSNYDGVTELFFDANRVGGGNGAARVNLNDSCLTKGVGQTIQFTGDGVTADIYCRITDVNGTKKIKVIKASNDPAITTNHKAFLVGPTVQIQNKQNNEVGKVRLNTTTFHDLEVGNKFTLINNSNENVGTFTVSDIEDVDTFKFVSPDISNIGDGYILKHGLSSNNAVSDKSEENLQVRATTLYDNDFLTLTNSPSVGITTTKIKVSHSGTGILNRFPIGTYVQIDDEILRISANTLSGTGNDELTVIRGVLATSPATHLNGSVVKKIRVPSIELRRPSILRASGHTFEYLGYGPGNYSTALPQVQDITLTEEEEFLTQSQEQSAGVVVYSGMNNRGDFFIGNQKKSSSTGEEITFDTPIPTITGEDPSRFSVVFDEVTVKERIVVEGGDSKLVLSQFDGPVNFDGDILLGSDSKLRLKNTTNSTSTTTGALVVAGGVGIGVDLNVGGNIIGNTSTNISGINSVTATKFVGPLEGNADTATTATNSINSGIETNDQNVSKNIVFVGQNTENGDNKPLQIDSDKTLTFNPSTNTLTCPTFVGNLTGNANTATSATTATTTTNSNKIKISVATGDSAKRLTFVDAGAESASGDAQYQNLKIDADSNLTFNPSTNTLTTKDVDVTGELNFTGFYSGGRYIDFVTKKDNNTSSAFLRLADSNQSAGGFQNAIEMKYDGNVKLHHSGTEKFRTQSTGAKVFGELRVEEDIIAFTGSDKRLKDNINPIADAINKVKSISGNTFEWNEKSNHQGEDTGVIAQEIEALGLPGTVETRSNGYKAVKYERLVPLLIEAIKELSDKVDVLEQKLSDK